MKPIKIYVSEFKGVNCREYLPSAHLSYGDADKEDCDITVLNGLIPDDWEVAESNYGDFQLYDGGGNHTPLIVNKNRQNQIIVIDRISSVSALHNDSQTVIARKNKPLFVAENNNVYCYHEDDKYELYKVLNAVMLAQQEADRLNEIEL